MIDKKKIDLEINEEQLCLSDGEQVRKWRPPLVVSLTSWPRRIGEAHYAIYSLFRQTMPPDRIILWLSPEEFPRREEELPKSILSLKMQGLTIEWRENYRQYNKLVHALKEYGECLIVTVDDDIYYPAEMLEMLYEEHARYPRDIIAHRVHEIGTGTDGNILPYGRWKKEIISSAPRLDVLQTGVGGVLYPGRGALHPDAVRSDLFNAIAHDNDDLWFWAMAARQGTYIRTPKTPLNRLDFVNPEKEKNAIDTLSSRNVLQRGNDGQMKKILAYYPDLLALLNCAKEGACQSQARLHEPSSLPMIVFPFHMFPPGSRVAVVGERELVLTLQREAKGQDYLSVAAVLPLEGTSFSHADLVPLCQRVFDFVLLAYLDRDKAKECKTFLMQEGIREKRIKWDGVIRSRDAFLRNTYFPLLKYLHHIRPLYRDKPATLPQQNRWGKIYYDVSFQSNASFGPGIRRVVDNLYLGMKNKGKNIFPVRCVENKVVTSEIFSDQTHTEKNMSLIRFTCQDHYFLPDGVWPIWEKVDIGIRQAMQEKCSVNALVYDLIPIRYPEFSANSKFLCNWMNLCFTKCNRLLCITRSVADDVIDYFQKWRKSGNHRTTPLKIYWIHLGYSFQTPSSGGVRPGLISFLEGGNTFLMVGTVCRRKGTDTAIKAFMELLSTKKNFKGRMLILGKNGWDDSSFSQLLTKCNETAQERILWIQDASDAEIQFSYKNARVLIQASITEGYGLPIVEAYSFGVPVICSDIPVFREVTQNHARFFPVGDTTALKKCIEECMEKEINSVPQERPRIYTWDECGQEVLDILEDIKKPYAILQ